MLFANYKRADVCFERGEGVWLYDTTGQRYLDFLGGIAVSSLGHAHPALVKAIQEQAGKLLHVSNLYRIPEQEAAGWTLAQLCRMDRVFFCNSGAEANECLLKMARRYAAQKGLPADVVVFENSFHGRTLATTSATGNPKYQEGYQPLLPGFRFAPYNDLPAALAALEHGCAVLLEPIQGEGGVVPADPAFLWELQSACRAAGKLLLLDEVQTGVGRTGEWLAAHHYGLEPDAVAVAKGLGGGVPVGAALAREKLASLITPGSHGTTFGGNPLAMAAVLAVLENVDLERVRVVGAYLKERLECIPGVREVRGHGLLLGVELEVPAGPVADACLSAGLLVNAVRPNTLRLAPPLILTRQEVDHGMKIIKDCLCPQTTSAAVANAPSCN